MAFKHLDQLTTETQALTSDKLLGIRGTGIGSELLFTIDGIPNKVMSVAGRIGDIMLSASDVAGIVSDVNSVNGKTGVVVLSASDIQDVETIYGSQAKADAVLSASVSALSAHNVDVNAHNGPWSQISFNNSINILTASATANAAEGWATTQTGAISGSTALCVISDGYAPRCQVGSLDSEINTGRPFRFAIRFNHITTASAQTTAHIGFGKISTSVFGRTLDSFGVEIVNTNICLYATTSGSDLIDVSSLSAIPTMYQEVLGEIIPGTITDTIQLFNAGELIARVDTPRFETSLLSSPFIEIANGEDVVDRQIKVSKICVQ